MHNYEHKKLVEAIAKLDEVPEDPQAFSEWIKAEAHLSFIRQNADEDDLVIYASGEYTFITAVVVSNDRLTPLNREDLMKWNLSPFRSVAYYVSDGRQDNVYIKRGMDGTFSETLDGGLGLIFQRTFEGWAGPEKDYYELHQEYAHLNGIHWRPEMRAYCRFDEHGDLEPLVSITRREDQGGNTALVSFKWESLEEYLMVSNASLVRMFDLTLLRRPYSSGWGEGAPEEIQESDYFFYHRKLIPGHAAYTRGVQIIRPRRDAREIGSGIEQGLPGRTYVEFTAFDWRNNRIAKISTDPNDTTNYFDAKDNPLTYELSPAFFKPEVLSKYKADRDKYSVRERDVSCRAAWRLEGIDVNEAGQVHAYICYLRRLPYVEQLHWLSFNEPPKATISKRAIDTDFAGRWTTHVEPLQLVLSIVQRWHDDRVVWWTLRNDKLFERVNTPLTTSRDEWAEAFMDLAKLVVEGFEMGPIRKQLDAVQAPYDEKDQTIALLEKLLNKGNTSGSPLRLEGLRTVQSLRSKVKGHAGGSESDQLAHDALMKHETFANHFREVCRQVAKDLRTIQTLFC